MPRTTTNPLPLEQFAVFILTHGRPDHVVTYRALRRQGYTGPIRLIVDDLDSTQERYKEKYGAEVVIFDKRKAGETIDMGDNRNEMRTITFARNASFGIAERLGFKYFMQLDDDFPKFQWRYDKELEFISGYIIPRSLDKVFAVMLEFYIRSGAHSLAMAQGGDFIGGQYSKDWAKSVKLKRKCMNSFICSTERPFKFIGRYNEDVNTYTRSASTGLLLLTTNQLMLVHAQSQSTPGGMTEIYREQGTYTKPFYSVMYQPSSVKIRMMHSDHMRVHHAVRWVNTVPKILRESVRKGTRPKSRPVLIPTGTMLDKVRANDLSDYLDMVAKFRVLDKQAAARIAAAAVRYYQGNHQVRDQLVGGQELENRWYASLKQGKPDYTVYDDDFFVSDIWACWVVYSRKYLKDLLSPKATPHGSIVAQIRSQLRSVADLGCGQGFTTAALKEIFPDTEVYGTNLEGTFQFQVAAEIGRERGFAVYPEATRPADLIFASEYFEHIEAPVEHLLDVLAQCRPRYLILANSFSARSIGHFNFYKHGKQKISNTAMGRIFNRTLRQQGFIQQKTTFWNNRPAFWAQQ